MAEDAAELAVWKDQLQSKWQSATRKLLATFETLLQEEVRKKCSDNNEKVAKKQEELAYAENDIVNFIKEVEQLADRRFATKYDGQLCAIRGLQTHSYLRL